MKFPTGWVPYIINPADLPSEHRYALRFPEGTRWPLVLLLTNWKKNVEDLLDYREARKKEKAKKVPAILGRNEFTPSQILDWARQTERLAVSADLPVDVPGMRVQLRNIAVAVREGVEFESCVLLVGHTNNDPVTAVNRRITLLIWGLEEFRDAFHAAFPDVPPFNDTMATFTAFVPQAFAKRPAQTAMQRLGRFRRQKAQMAHDAAERAFVLTLSTMTVPYRRIGKPPTDASPS